MVMTTTNVEEVPLHGFAFSHTWPSNLTWPFLPYVLFLTGASAQFVLTQPASVSARLEGRVQISCTRSSGAMSGYYMSWYQQKSVEPPKLLIYQHVYRPADVPDRFSGVTDSSKATLTITGVQPEDEAEYYCQSYDGNWMFHRSWGQFVLTQPPTLSVAPGGRAVISCTRNTASINKYHVSWYQQKPNSLPKLLIYQHNKRPPGIPERFSGFTGGSSATLTISNVQEEDLADYYCSSYDSNWLPTAMPSQGEVKQKPISLAAEVDPAGKKSLIYKIPAFLATRGRLPASLLPLKR
ncbi:uncharacterized protein [Pituophis catenifer annectens]|uniref:uncharacterized protein n=1 Tax=Pituophis catenifer annectens TaxID=94852 RepID=UPI003995A404